MFFFLKGLLIAVIFGLPAGAIGVLCINRSLEKGFISGFVSGLGSSVADTIFAIIGVYGVGLVHEFLHDQNNQNYIALAGGIVIVIFGIIMILKAQENLQKGSGEQCQNISAASLIADFWSTFVIAILNPATIISFGVAFVTFELNFEFTFQKALVILGIFTGTVLWWFVISFGVSRFRNKITVHKIKLMRVVCGCVLVLLGIVCFVKGVIPFVKVLFNGN